MHDDNQKKYKYILNNNKQDSKTGENYELHNEETCEHLPEQGNRLEVGYYKNCKEAIDVAKKKYFLMAKDIDGCYWCCNKCHSE